MSLRERLKNILSGEGKTKYALHQSYGLVEITENSPDNSERIIILPLMEDAQSIFTSDMEAEETISTDWTDQNGMDNGETRAAHWFSPEYREVYTGEIVPLNTLSESSIAMIMDSAEEEEILLSTDYDKYPWELNEDERVPEPCETSPIFGISNTVALTEEGKPTSPRTTHLTLKIRGRDYSIKRYNDMKREWELMKGDGEGCSTEEEN